SHITSTAAVPLCYTLSLHDALPIYFVKENILGCTDSLIKNALSIGLGVFMGIAPFWGFQTVITITLAVFLRLNKVLAFVFSNISFAPLIPLVIYASLAVGSMVYPSSTT